MCAHCNYSFIDLESNTIPTLDSVMHGLHNTGELQGDLTNIDDREQYYLLVCFNKMMDHTDIHKEGLTAGPEIEKALKKYKSH